MNLYGYLSTSTTDTEPQRLSEASLQVTTSELESIIKFLQFAHSEMKEMGSDFDHVHYQDFLDSWSDDAPDIIVIR